MAVEQFRGEYFPLSNMYRLSGWILTDCGIAVPTSEHAYMSNRLKDPTLQEQVALVRGEANDPRVFKDGLAAKELTHRFIAEGAEQTFASDDAKIALMRRVVAQKVTLNGEVRELLRSTGDMPIEEGNEWGDRFWGVCPPGSGRGQNHLGRILMEIRETL